MIAKPRPLWRGFFLPSEQGDKCCQSGDLSELLARSQHIARLPAYLAPRAYRNDHRRQKGCQRRREAGDPA